MRSKTHGVTSNLAQPVFRPLWSQPTDSSRGGGVVNPFAGYALLDGTGYIHAAPITQPAYPMTMEVSFSPTTATSSITPLAISASVSSSKFFAIKLVNSVTISVDRRNPSSVLTNVTVPDMGTVGAIDTYIRVVFHSATDFDLYHNNNLITNTWSPVSSVVLDADFDTVTPGLLRIVSPAGFFTGKLWDCRITNTSTLISSIPLTHGTADADVGPDGVVVGGVTFPLA